MTKGLLIAFIILVIVVTAVTIKVLNERSKVTSNTASNMEIVSN